MKRDRDVTVQPVPLKRSRRNTNRNILLSVSDLLTEEAKPFEYLLSGKQIQVTSRDARFSIHVDSSLRRHGVPCLGVFAKEKIKEDEFVFIYTGKVTSEDSPPVDMDYVYAQRKDLPDGREQAIYIDGREGGGVSALINHSSEYPNLIVREIENIPHFYATRDIEIGEQILWDYGPDYNFEGSLCQPERVIRSEFLTDEDIEERVSVRHNLLNIELNVGIFYGFATFLARESRQPHKEMSLSDLELNHPFIEFDASGKRTSHYVTPLMFAIMTENIRAIEYLKIHKNLAYNCINNDGQTAAFFLTFYKSNLSSRDERVLSAVLEKTNLSIRDKYGKTAMDWCIELGNTPILKLMERKIGGAEIDTTRPLREWPSSALSTTATLFPARCNQETSQDSAGPFCRFL